MFFSESVESIQSRNDQGRMHPKVLGLSASPASKDTVEQTHKKLKDLLANLGKCNNSWLCEYTLHRFTLCRSDNVAQAIITTTEKADFYVTRNLLPKVEV